MELHRLFLRNFRNYRELDLSFDAPVHVIYGANASGKTNILEAIYYLATAQSHRTHRPQELIRWGTPGFFIKARVVRRDRPIMLEFLYDEQGRRGLKVNGLSKQSLGDLYGRFNAVFFSPEDLQLVKGAPSQRRRFIDFELSQVSDTYHHVLGEYRQALSQRNNLLKEMRSRGGAPDLLAIWDDQLVRHGADVIVRRIRALRELKVYLEDEHGRLAGEKEQLTLDYACSATGRNVTGLLESVDQGELFDFVSSCFERQVVQQRDEELSRGYTLSGPHRDDLVFTLNGKEARSFASQGQQRTIVLALKLASVTWMEGQQGESPVLLLDDVLSELDSKRRSRLLERTVEGVQTFITCTDLADVQDELPGEANVYHVSDGQARLERGVL